MISRATYRQIISSSMVLLCSFLYGCKIGYIQSLTRLFMSADSPFQVTANEISWIASISFTGTSVSVFLCYVLGNKVARKKFLFSCAVVFFFAWLLILTTTSVSVIIVCFFLYGIAASMIVTVGNIYFSEIATPRNREILVISYGLACALGSQLEILLSIFECYRLLTLFPFLMSVLTLAASVLMVESPCYLVSKNLKSQAIANLCWLNDKRPRDVQDTLRSLQQYVDEQKGRKLSSLKTILVRSNLKLLLVMLFINTTSHVTCIPIIMQYGSLIVNRFQTIVNGRLFVSVYSSAMVVAGGLSLFTVKLFGRRTMLLGGILMSALLQQYCAVCFYIEEQHADKIQYLAVEIAVLLVAHLLVTATMYGAGMMVLKSEIFPHNLKEFYTSLLSFTSDSVTFLVVKSFIGLSSSIGIHSVLLLYSFFAYVTAVLVYLFISDTKGKSLHQIRTEYSAAAAIDTC